MKLENVRAHVLKNERFDNWNSEVAGRWKIDDLRADARYRDSWISFDSLAWHGGQGKLYIGLASIANDIFWSFDPGTGSFTSLNYRGFGDKFDAKFHRSLEVDGDRLYAATALLHDVDQQFEAKGGKLLRYDVSRGEYELLAIPVPHQYIQSITLDRRRGIIYGFTYPAEYLFRHDISSGQTETIGYVGNGVMLCQPHNAALDRQGRLWGTWGESRAFEDDMGPVPVRIFCYDPDSRRVTWFQHGLPKTSPDDPARVDHMLLGADDFIYVGTVAGGFSRLDPETGTVEDLGRPFEGPRLAGLLQGSDGLIYGAGNGGYAPDGTGTARLFAFDPATKACRDLGAIWDPAMRDGAVKIHMLVESEPGVLYAGENDNTLRSSYLWECRIAA